MKRIEHVLKFSAAFAIGWTAAFFMLLNAVNAQEKAEDGFLRIEVDGKGLFIPVASNGNTGQIAIADSDDSHVSVHCLVAHDEHGCPGDPDLGYEPDAYYANQPNHEIDGRVWDNEKREWIAKTQLAQNIAPVVVQSIQAQTPPFPWPSDYVKINVRDWHVNNGDESFALITQALTEMNASPNAAVRTASTMLRDRIAVAAKLIPEGGDVTSVAVYKAEFEDIMRIVSNVTDPDKVDEIRAGFLQVLQAEFEPRP